MTLNEMIGIASIASYQLSTGAIPIYVDGKEVNNIQFRIHLDGEVKPYVEMIIKQ